jgi:hypothetical protein
MLGWEFNCESVRVHSVNSGNQPAKNTDDLPCTPFRFPVVESL